MEAERVAASKTIEAPSEAVFAAMADLTAHADIDGTGWVSGYLDNSLQHLSDLRTEVPPP